MAKISVKVMVVPGKVVSVVLDYGATVLDACEVAARVHEDIDWVQLAKSREVRVQNKKYSNKQEIPDDYYGNIMETALNDLEVVLILTKIAGNVGLGVLTCNINGQEYSLETPDTLKNVLRDVVGMNTSNVQRVIVNGSESPISQLVGNGDTITVLEYTYGTPRHGSSGSDCQKRITVQIDGKSVTGKVADIKKILEC